MDYVVFQGIALREPLRYELNQILIYGANLRQADDDVLLQVHHNDDGANCLIALRE
jgi:hypothetical protein